MESLYAQYLKERTNDKIVEIEHGFATYRYQDDGKTVYIVDIFVKREFRKDGFATKMADRIAKEAKEKGCTKMLGSVVPSAKNSTISMQVLLAYGMTLYSSINDFVMFEKEI